MAAMSVEGFLVDSLNAWHLLSADRDPLGAYLARGTEGRKLLLQHAAKAEAEGNKMVSRDRRHGFRLLAVARYLQQLADQSVPARVATSEQVAQVIFRRKDFVAKAIRSWAKSWLMFGSVPGSAQGKHPKFRSLVFDEKFRQRCKAYLRSVKAGEVTVMDFRSHLNSVSLPLCGVTKPICEATARVWLRSLGWHSHDVKHGVYVDGHERVDVVAARKKFLEKMSKYRTLMSTFEGDDCHEVLPSPETLRGKKLHVLLVHDESTFASNDGRRVVWVEDGHRIIRPKGDGKCLMISAILSERHGELCDEGCKNACHDTNFNHSRVVFTPGNDKWWNAELLVQQLDNSMTMNAGLSIALQCSCSTTAQGILHLPVTHLLLPE